MKTGPTADKQKKPMRTVVKVIIAAVVIVGVVVAFAETNGFYTGVVTKYFYTTSYAPISTTVTLRAIDTGGHLVTNATYKVGDTFDLSITEVSNANPIAVHQVFNGNVTKDLAWNVNATGHTYILHNVAHADDLGTHTGYVVVAFDVGDQEAISNDVTITITN